jgi:hypothetical protein
MSLLSEVFGFPDMSAAERYWFYRRHWMFTSGVVAVGAGVAVSLGLGVLSGSSTRTIVVGVIVIAAATWPATMVGIKLQARADGPVAEPAERSTSPRDVRPSQLIVPILIVGLFVIGLRQSDEAVILLLDAAGLVLAAFLAVMAVRRRRRPGS